MPPSLQETPVLEDPGATQRSVGWCFAGAGFVGLTAGVYFVSQWIDTRSLSNLHCPGGTCDALGTSLRNDAQSQAIVAATTLAGGATAFVIGAALVASAPRARIVMSSARLEVSPMLGPTAGGVHVRGTW